MAYAFVQLKEAFSTSLAVQTLATGNFGSTVATGNLIVAVAMYSHNFGLTPTFSDTLGNTYSSVFSGFDGTGFYGLAVAVAKNITGGGANSVTVDYTTPPSATRGGVMAAEYSGFDTTTPYTATDRSGLNGQQTPGTGTDGVTSGNTPTLSSGDGGLIGFSFSTSLTPAAGTGLSSRGTGWAGGNPFRLEDKAIAATTATAATWTAGSNVDHYSFAVYLKNLVVAANSSRLLLLGVG